MWKYLAQNRCWNGMGAGRTLVLQQEDDETKLGDFPREALPSLRSRWGGMQKAEAEEEVKMGLVCEINK